MTAPPTMDLTPIRLEGRWIRLEPLNLDHTDALMAASMDSTIWQYLPHKLTTLSDIQSWISEALALQTAGSALPFVIIDQAHGQAIGSTRYMNISPTHRAVEIGWTWLARAVWRTPVNSECKLLLLRHAFETLHCIRVQFKTDQRNERSRRAIERLGAQYEGTLRQHMIMPDGVYRDSVFYSILDSEWPAVKARLTLGLYET